MTSGVSPAAQEALGGLPGIRARRIPRFRAVAAGVFLRIADGGLDKLDADGALRLPRKAERDGARAAIEVKDRLGPGQAGCCQRFAVEPLCLRAVDLIERARRDAEAQARTRISSMASSPQSVRMVSPRTALPLRVFVLRTTERRPGTALRSVSTRASSSGDARR